MEVDGGLPTSGKMSRTFVPEPSLWLLEQTRFVRVSQWLLWWPWIDRATSGKGPVVLHIAVPWCTYTGAKFRANRDPATSNGAEILVLFRVCRICWGEIKIRNPNNGTSEQFLVFGNNLSVTFELYNWSRWFSHWKMEIWKTEEIFTLPRCRKVRNINQVSLNRSWCLSNQCIKYIKLFLRYFEGFIK